jgi:hypothetical protein
VQPLWKTVCRLLKNIKIRTAISLLETYLKECKSEYNQGTCIPMLTAALFTIAKLRKQPRCPSTDECIKKMWYLYAIQFYSAIKKNEILLFAGKWMELAQKAKSHVFSYMWNIERIQIHQYYEKHSH